MLATIAALLLACGPDPVGPCSESTSEVVCYEGEAFERSEVEAWCASEDATSQGAKELCEAAGLDVEEEE